MKITDSIFLLRPLHHLISCHWFSKKKCWVKHFDYCIFYRFISRPVIRIVGSSSFIGMVGLLFVLPLCVPLRLPFQWSIFILPQRGFTIFKTKWNKDPCKLQLELLNLSYSHFTILMSATSDTQERVRLDLAVNVLLGGHLEKCLNWYMSEYLILLLPPTAPPLFWEA